MSDRLNDEGYVLVVGSSGLDMVCRSRDELRYGTSNPGVLRISPGGVARNVAENIARLGMNVSLITAVGDDPQGEQLLKQTADAGVDIEHSMVIPDCPTGTYLAILGHDGSLHLGMDSMQVTAAIEPKHLRERKELFKDAALLFVDANLPSGTLKTAFSLAWRAGVPIAADPTSVSLAPALRDHLERLWLITLNEAEAETLCDHPVPHADRESAIEAARHIVSEGVDVAIITMAEFGLSYATANSSGHVPAVKTEIVDPTGAGDALSAAVIFALLNNIPIDEAVMLGASAAARTLRTTGTVIPDLSLEMLYEELL